MNSMISWCTECHRYTVLDQVPDTVADEYACRDCAAAYLVEPTPHLGSQLLAAA